MKFLLLLVLFATSSVLAQDQEATTDHIGLPETDKVTVTTVVTDAPTERETTHEVETTHSEVPTTETSTATHENGTSPATEASNTTAAEASTEAHTSTEPPHTTPTPIETTTPVTPPHAQPSYEPAQTWKVQNGTNGTVCLIVQIAIQLRVKYNQTNNETVTTYINLPKTANETDANKCGEEYDTIGLTWNDLYTLELVFTKNLTDNQYGLYQVTFNYTINPQDFPSAQENGSVHVSHILSPGDLVGHVGKSYKCDTNKKVDLNGNVELYYQTAQVQAFTNSDKFGTVEECPADDKTDDIVPIAVGCALAGLVIIVLIAYMVGRRRSRQKGYQSV